MAKSLFFKLFFCFSFIFIQQIQAQTYHKFRVVFNNKDNSPYSYSNPQQYLSQRAIDRRNAQGIAINWYDIPINPWYLDSLSNLGVNIINKSKWFNSAIIETTDYNKLSQIAALPFVVRIDSVAQTNLKANNKPNNLKPNTQERFIIDVPIETFNNTNYREKGIEEATTIRRINNPIDYGNATNQIEMLNGHLLHNMGFQGQGMVIAVLDAGFFRVNSLAAFDSLWLNNRILGYKDFVEPNSDIFSKSTHGMTVLSTMGGNLPGQLVGTAPQASYYLLRSEDAATEFIIEEDNWAAAAEYADSVGADIINSSLGYTEFDDISQNHTYANMDGNSTIVTRAADMAVAKGMIVVNSAGNSGSQSWHYIGAPADGDSVLTVGAVDVLGNLAYFSSVGPTYDGRIKPNVCALGLGSAVAGAYGGTSYANGTSFASPITAGMVACLWQANRSKTNIEIINAIQQSASIASSPNFSYGYGIPDFFAANALLTGVSIPELTQNCTIFPNPFNNHIFVTLFSSDYQKISIELVDIQAKSHFRKYDIPIYAGYNQFVLENLENLKKGMYLLRINHNGGTIIKKIIK